MANEQVAEAISEEMRTLDALLDFLKCSQEANKEVDTIAFTSLFEITLNNYHERVTKLLGA